MHPYHIQLQQELHVDDYQSRLEFCVWAQNTIRVLRNFVHLILFGDEATFHRNGSVNRHNFHYYPTENPYFVRYSTQNRWSLNVWGGVIGDNVIGPYFFEQRVTGEVYLDLTKMDFSVWGFVKDQVYRISPTTREDMKIRIQNCFRSITVEMCRNLNRSFEKRLELCIREIKNFQ